MDEKTIVFRLILGAIFGGVIGLEREASNRPAGFRTHILVSVGSTLIILVSMNVFGDNADPSRMAAQVVSGIGFLGAGTIMKTGSTVKGLTTAASLWVCSAIGLAVGGGYYLGATVTAGVVLFSLAAVGTMEKTLFTRNLRTIEIRGKSRPGFVGDIGTIFGKHNIAIRSIEMVNSDYESEEPVEDISFLVKLPHYINTESLYRDLSDIVGLYRITINEEEIINKQ